MICDLVSTHHQSATCTQVLQTQLADLEQYPLAARLASHLWRVMVLLGCSWRMPLAICRCRALSAVCLGTGDAVLSIRSAAWIAFFFCEGRHDDV